MLNLAWHVCLLCLERDSSEPEMPLSPKWLFLVWIRVHPSVASSMQILHAVSPAWSALNTEAQARMKSRSETPKTLSGTVFGLQGLKLDLSPSVPY